MKIESVRIQNLRAFKDVTIPFNDYTCFVGANGAGKSTVLCALNIFFREKDNAATNLLELQAEDFHNKNTDDPIQITVTFSDLSEDAQEDFKDYFRQGKLIVTAKATYNVSVQKAEVKQYGQRLAMTGFSAFFRVLGDGAKADELKEVYNGYRKSYAELPAWKSKAATADKLKEYEAAHPEQCELTQSGDQFYGVSRGVDRLEKYIQWIYVPAVKNAVEEEKEARNSALGKLLERTVRAKTDFAEDIAQLKKKTEQAYQGILDKNQGVLTELSTSLGSRIKQWGNPNASLRLVWGKEPDKTIRVEEPFAEIIAGEGSFEGQLARLGHGLQRSFIISLLQELVTFDNENSPKLILACEEPELYQHPPQIRHLADLFNHLSTQNAQVMVCSHSPFFVSGEGFENVRMVRMNDSTNESSVSWCSYGSFATYLGEILDSPPSKEEGVIAKINQELQPSINEIFFTPTCILVEGLEDVAYIKAYMILMGKWDEFRRLQCHIVPANGKSHLIRPYAIAKKLDIHTFVVFDSDGHEQDKGKRNKHRKDNEAIIKIFGAEAEPFPEDHQWSDGLVIWKSEMGKAVTADFQNNVFTQYAEKARIECGQEKGLGKNTLFIASWLALAWADGHKSETLEKLCLSILNFAAKRNEIAEESGNLKA